MTTPPAPKSSRKPTQITDETGRNVAANVRRVRELRGHSTYDLSRLMEAAGRPIAPSGIAKLERGERRVDVGDLTALAVILRVNPSALLLPLKDGPADSVEITGGGTVGASEAWDWMDGKRPLGVALGDMDALLDFDLYSRPAGRRHSWRYAQDVMPADAGPVIDRLRQEGADG